MTRTFPWLPVIALAALLPATFGAMAQDDRGVGAARTEVSVLDVAVSDLSAGPGDLDASLGSLVLLSRTDEPAAHAILDGLTAQGERIAGLAATHDGPTREGASIPLDVAGLLSGDVTLAEVLAAADAERARSRIGVLTGQLAAGPLDLAVDLDERGLQTAVDADAATSTLEVGLGGLSLTLGDLLPAAVLEDLPLGVLLELAGTPDLSLSEDLLDQVEELTRLVKALHFVDVALGELRTVRAQLRELVPPELEQQVQDAEAAVAAAEQALADARAALPALRTAVADAEDEVAALADDLADATADRDAAAAVVADAQAVLDGAEQDLADAEAVEAAAAQTVDDLQAELDALDAELALLDPVLDAVEYLETEAERDRVAGDLADAQDDLDAAEQVVADAEAAVADAQDDLDAAQVDLDAAQDVVDDLTADLDAAEQTLADAEAALADARAAVADAEAALADAEADLDALLDTIAGTAADTLREQVQRLRSTLRDLLDTVESILDGLPDLDRLLEDLLAGLRDAPLLDVGDATVGFELRADAQRGSVDVTCDFQGVTVLGQAVPTGDCGALSESLRVLDEVLGGALGALPLDGVPAVEVGGLSIERSASDAPQDGVTRARLAVEGLHVGVPSVSLTSAADELTARLEGLVASAEGAAARLLEQQTGISLPSGFQTADLQALQALLAELDAQVAALPTGADLAGLRTVGLDVTAGDLLSQVAFSTTGSFGGSDPFAAPEPPTDGGAGSPDPSDGGNGAPDPSDGPDGPDGAPGAPDAPGSDPSDPTGAPELPSTGGGAAMGGALLLAAAWLRRRVVR